MKFLLLDKIIDLQPGKRIETIKNLTLAEEYLGDHFPTFPILPGVLMLEMMTQSAAWLVRLQQDFAYSLINLRAARNVKYVNMLKPGQTLRAEVELTKIDDENRIAKFKASAYTGENLVVSARLELTWANVAEKGDWGKKLDESVHAQIQHYWRLVGGPAALEKADA